MTKIYYQQGIFQAKNLQRYKGTLPIIYRSRAEFQMMKLFDCSSKVIEWASESVIVPYVKPTDGKVHRYFIDFYVKERNADGSTTKWLYEYKPYRQRIPPIKGRKSERTWLTEQMTWATNQCKWKAAEAYAKTIGAKFVILSEKDLGQEVY